MHAIRQGRARLVVVGTSEAPLVPEVMEGYRAMGALAEDEALAALDGAASADLRRACRPFGDNCGFTMAESAQFAVLMDDALALELGAQALREAPEAQALLLPGGLWYAIHAVPLLEAEFDKPVLLNITSTTWAALNAAPKPLLHRPNPKWGKVLSSV